MPRLQGDGPPHRLALTHHFDKEIDLDAATVANHHPPGGAVAYNAIVYGVTDTSGNGVVEVYLLNDRD